MARIAGVDLPRNKRTNIALTYIYGIGNSRSARVFAFGQTERLRLMVELTECQTWLSTDSPRAGIDMDALHAREIDHETAVTNSWPGVRSVYMTTPGGVPSVRPVTVSRQMYWPLIRRKSE